MRTVGIVQARMTSTRLPGKVLMEVLDKPLLEYELERLRRVVSLDDLVVATTTNREDDPVVALCERLAVPVYRGSENDVLSRYYEAAALFRADAVVRFTADCPLIDPLLSHALIGYYLENRDKYDYCATSHATYPRGIDTEACSFTALEEAHREGITQAEREHVTYFIHSRPERYRIYRMDSGQEWGQYRLTVDTPEDFELIKQIIEKLYPADPCFDLAKIIHLLQINPDLLTINSKIRQKET
jgi:Spore coat polysaccharide biosynthesis protein F, CMP-KDO synthetase homolog